MPTATAIATTDERAWGRWKTRWNCSARPDDADTAALVLGAFSARAERLLMSDVFYGVMVKRFGLTVDGVTVLVGEVLAGFTPELYLPGRGQVERTLRLPEQAEADPEFIRREAFGTDGPEAAEGVTAGGVREPGEALGWDIFADAEEEIVDGPDYALEYHLRRNATFPQQSLSYLFPAQVIDEPFLQHVPQPGQQTVQLRPIRSRVGHSIG